MQWAAGKLCLTASIRSELLVEFKVTYLALGTSIGLYRHEPHGLRAVSFAQITTPHFAAIGLKRFFAATFVTL